MRDFGQCNLERSICRRVIGGRGIRHNRNGTTRDRLLDVVIAVGRLAAHRDKKGARHDATRVVFHAADDNVLANASQHSRHRGVLHSMSKGEASLWNLIA